MENYQLNSLDLGLAVIMSDWFKKRTYVQDRESWENRNRAIQQDIVYCRKALFLVKAMLKFVVVFTHFRRTRAQGLVPRASPPVAHSNNISTIGFNSSLVKVSFLMDQK